MLSANFYRQLHTSSAVLLLLFAIVAWSFSANSVPHRLQFIQNDTLVGVMMPCHVGVLFVVALLFQTLEHLVASCRAHTVVASVNNITLPVLHVGILTGIANVNSMWAVFAVVSLVLLMQGVLRHAHAPPPAWQKHTDALAVLLYIIFWGIVWAVQPAGRHVHKAVQLGSFTMGQCIIAAAYVILLRHARAQKSDDIAQSMQNLVHVCSHVGFSMVSVAAWVAANDGNNNQYFGVAGVVVLYILWALVLTHNVHHIETHPVSHPLVDLAAIDESCLYDSDNSDGDPYSQAADATSSVM